MSKNNEIIDVNDILKRFDAMLQMISDDIGNEIETSFETAIEAFYADYDPNIYDRTGNIKRLSSGYDDPSSVSVKLGKYRYIAGIKVSPSFVSVSAYKKNPHHGLHVTPRFVYNISYMRGIHGFNKSDLIYKRDRATGKILRGDSRLERKSVLREDKWKPGYWDETMSQDLFIADVFKQKPLRSYIKKERANSFNQMEHVPPNGPVPDKMVHETHKNIVKNLDRRIIDAMSSIFSG